MSEQKATSSETVDGHGHDVIGRGESLSVQGFPEFHVIRLTFS